MILFYTNPEDKRQVLFSYLKAGLDGGGAAAYLAGQEEPDQVREAMKRFDIEVDVWSIILEKVSPPNDCDSYNKFV